MPFEEYRGKRKFGETPEPSGHKKRSSGEKRIFVLQKHDATRLHYDSGWRSREYCHRGPYQRAVTRSRS
jgi:hypothetical protein